MIGLWIINAPEFRFKLSTSVMQQMAYIKFEEEIYKMRKLIIIIYGQSLK